MRRTHYLPLLLVVALIALFAFQPYLQSPKASGIAFQTGDVFAGVGNGRIKHFRSDGTLVDTLLTTANNNFDTGMGFDAAGNLYATGFDGQAVYKFDNNGAKLGSFGGGYNRDPESIVFDTNGNAYVGQADGSHQILKFSPAGALLDTYSPQIDGRGTDWIDLASDQCTIFYTSEGAKIKRFNVCTKTQLPDFVTSLASPCYANRIRPNGEVLVACASQAYRLNSSGGVMQTYSLPGDLFALNLDPDNKTFWTGGLSSGTVFRVDIATGAIVTQFNSAPFNLLAGLAVAGEITAATTAPPSTKSYYIRNPTDPDLSGLLKAAGKSLAQQQAAAGIAQDSVVALLFGAQTFVGGQPAATLWGKNLRLSDVSNLVEAFATGYYNCFGTGDCPGTSQSNQNMHVRIVIATNNSGSNVTSTAGQQWAAMVNDVASRIIAKGYAGRVDIAAGNDMEPDYADPGPTRQWVNGYAQVAPRRFLYNVGAASGCSTNPATQTAAAGRCGTSSHPTWTQEDVWHISWGADPAQPLPEIYTPSQPKQWMVLSLYGALNPARRNGGSVIMSGALTQLGACIQISNNDPTCKPQPFTPQQGWLKLFDQLKSDTRTQQTLAWSTDIRMLRKTGDITSP